MTTADVLNMCGIAVTGAGSTVAMVGVYYQMNGYFAIKPSNIFGQFLIVFRKLLKEGRSEALKQLNVDAKLGEAKSENRGKSLIGFYLVLAGFLLQMAGSALLIGALVAGSAAKGKVSGNFLPAGDSKNQSQIHRT